MCFALPVPCAKIQKRTFTPWLACFFCRKVVALYREQSRAIGASVCGRSTTESVDVQPQLCGRTATDLWMYSHRTYGRTAIEPVDVQPWRR